MKKLFLGLAIIVTLFGITTFEQYMLMPPSVRAQTNTFCAANLACTVTAAWTFSGMVSINGVKYVSPLNPQGWAGSDLAAWVASAFASCGTSTSCTVNVTLGSYPTPSSSILVGDQTNLCPNYPGNQAQTLVLDMVQVTINNPIKIGCGGFLVGNQMNMFGSWITAGASLPAGAMIQAGDGVHNINAGVAFLRLNCNSVAGCQGVSFKLTNDDSYIRNMLIQNNMGDGITVDGTGGGSLTAGYMIIGENFVAAAATATNTNCIKLNKTAIPHLLRNSCVSNSAGNQTAGVYLTGGQDHDALIQALYCEKMTNCILADGNDSFTAIGIRAGNGTTNTIHLSGTAGGTVQAWGIENNSNTVILNDVTGFTEASTNPPAPFGVIGCYIWSRVSNFEEYCDIQGHHWRGGGGGTAFVDLASGATLRMQNSGATETGLLGADVFGAGNIGLGTSTAHGLEFRTNGTSRVLIPSGGGLVSFAAGATDLGSTSLPFGNLWLGTAATNNFKFQPAATSGARIITIADPLSPSTVALPLTIASGTSAMTTALIATVACGTTVTTAATGVLTTDVIDTSFNAAVTAANNGLLIFKAWPTAGNVNFNYCNPTAAGLTPTAMTVNWSVRRP